MRASNRRQFLETLAVIPTWAVTKERLLLSASTNNPQSRRRAEILSHMERVMGPFPKEKVRPPLDMRVLGSADTTNVSRLKISYASEKGDRTPGYLLKPKRLEGRVPGILCLHQTTPLGAAEPAGLGGNPNYHYALELAERGCVTLAPDYPGVPQFPWSKGFGGYLYDSYRHGYSSQTMKGIWNHTRAVDLLQSMPEVDPGRIGCIGQSLGAHNTLFVGAFDERIRVLVCSCGFTSFAKQNGGDLSGWGQEVYMSLIPTKFHNNPAEMPFEFSDVLTAIAPRPLFINAALHDQIFDVSGVRDTINRVRPVYKDFRAGDRLVLEYPNARHSFPKYVRDKAYEFLDRFLKA